jgi:hypothetical protein
VKNHQVTVSALLRAASVLTGKTTCEGARNFHFSFLCQRINRKDVTLSLFFGP